MHVNQALTPGIRWVGTWVCDVDKATCTSVATLGYAARNTQFVFGVNSHTVPLVHTPAAVGVNRTPMVVIVIVRNPLWQLPWVADQLIDTPYVRRHRPIPDYRHYLAQASGSLGYAD